MGPKSAAETRASVPPKDLSWIDRMYLKLENMCVEVDKNPSILLQETSKYVESHMNVVGANVKKLCTELIQDLISPPILSSEGAEKVSECAIHCKCHCMDFEKPTQKDVDVVIKGSNPKAGHVVIPAKGFEEGYKIIESINYQMQDILKGGDLKGETRQEEFTMQAQTFNIEGSPPRKPEGSCKELNNIGGADYGEEFNTAVVQGELKTLLEAHEFGTETEIEERQSIPKAHSRLHGEKQDESINAHPKNSIFDESRKMGEEKCVNAVDCRGDVDLAQQAITPKENFSEEFNTVDGQIAAHIHSVPQSSVMARELRHRAVKVQHQVVDVLYETHASRSKSVSRVCSEGHTSHAKMQSSLDLTMDAKNAKFFGKNIERKEVKETNEVGGDLQSMYSYVFSELSRSNEEDPMFVAHFLIGDDLDDEEQSAHWFDGQDLKKALRTENSCMERVRQEEGYVKEYDSDWEMV